MQCDACICMVIFDEKLPQFRAQNLAKNKDLIIGAVEVSVLEV